MKTTALNDA